MSGGGFTNLHSFSFSDGGEPLCELVASGNILYGTTTIGGLNGFGDVFAMAIDGGGFTNFYNFSGPDGWSFPMPGWFCREIPFTELPKLAAVRDLGLYLASIPMAVASPTFTISPAPVMGAILTLAWRFLALPYGTTAFERRAGRGRRLSGAE